MFEHIKGNESPVGAGAQQMSAEPEHEVCAVLKNFRFCVVFKGVYLNHSGKYLNMTPILEISSPHRSPAGTPTGSLPSSFTPFLLIL